MGDSATVGAAVSLGGGAAGPASAATVGAAVSGVRRRPGGVAGTGRTATSGPRCPAAGSSGRPGGRLGRQREDRGAARGPGAPGEARRGGVDRPDAQPPAVGAVETSDELHLPLGREPPEVPGAEGPARRLAGDRDERLVGEVGPPDVPGRHAAPGDPDLADPARGDGAARVGRVEQHDVVVGQRTAQRGAAAGRELGPERGDGRLRRPVQAEDPTARRLPTG